MKTIAVILLTLALCPAAALAAAQEPGSRIYVVHGDVLVTQGKNPPHRVINGEPIIPDTIVTTGDNSAALLKFEDGQVATMQANSTFQVHEYTYDAAKIRDSGIVFSMFKGGMRFVSGLIGQKNGRAFRLSTPNATVGIRGTDFMLTIVGDTMYGHVLSGDITITNGAGTAAFGAGQSASVASSAAPASAISLLAVPSGAFDELLSIPVDPSAIPAPGAAAASAPALAPVPIPAAAPAAGEAEAGGAVIAAPGGEVQAEKAEAAAPETGKKEKPAEAGKVAEETVAAAKKSGVGVTAKLGTLGLGMELNFGISDRFSSRVGVNAFTYKYNGASSQLNYDFDWKLRTASAFVDWYPFQGSFRASAGVLYDDNKVSFSAIPTNGTFTINGTSYTTAEVGSFSGTMTFDKTAPYIGIGWGNPVAKRKGWGLVTDVGALYQNRPKIDLVVTCNDPLVCAALQTDAAAENAKLRGDLGHFKWWPVLSIGVSYQW